MAKILIKIVVTDATTKRPIAGVKLNIIGAHGERLETTSDPKGLASLQLPNPGTIHIAARTAEYPEQQTAVLVPPNQSKPIELALHPRKNVFFAIYYRVPDNAFGRAAKTWADELNGGNPRFRLGRDVVKLIEADTEAAFKQAWSAVDAEGQLPGREVVEGRLFTHASKGEGNDGLEFRPGQGDDGTIGNVELMTLNRLKWAKDGLLAMHGCNTGTGGSRGWAPAGSIASAQGIATVGQKGYSYFSANPARYEEINAGSPRVYLWAYRRNRNGVLGGGERIEAVTYR